MDTRMQYSGEIFEAGYENQSNKLWIDNIDEIAGQLDWDDSDQEISGGSKYATKTNYVQASKNLYTERKRRKKLNDTLYTLRSVVPKISKVYINSSPPINSY